MPRSVPLSLSRRPRASGSALCRRQILRRPHDLAGAGGVPASRTPGRCLPRISAASARATVGRTRPAPPRCANSDVVPSGDTRRFADLELMKPLVARARRACHVEAVPGCRPLLSCAGAHRTEGPGGQKRTVARRCRLDRIAGRSLSALRPVTGASRVPGEINSQARRPETIKNSPSPFAKRFRNLRGHNARAYRQQCSTVSLAGV